jgi:hypothetical protein
MAANVWPFEGHFVVGGSGLYVAVGCLGQTVESRTGGYEVTIGLPQVDTTPDPYPPEVRRQLDAPRGGLLHAVRDSAIMTGSASIIDVLGIEKL